MLPTEPARVSRKGRPAPSLKIQAITWLSNREHSRQELREKLLASVRRRENERRKERQAIADAEALEDPGADDAFANGIDDAFRPAAGAMPATPDADSPEVDPAAEVDALLDWLEAQGYLSDARFVESRVHARSGRQGTSAIRHELARHGLTLDEAQAAALRGTEFARAKAVWDRKFGALAADAKERARQARFLAARGFAADVVRRVVGGDDAFE